MIIDVHTHCLQPDHISDETHAATERAGYPPMQPLLPATYLAGMESVDRAIVFGIRAVAGGMSSPNDSTAAWVQHAPGKLIGFMGIDPGEEGFLEEIDRGRELGLRGIKLYPMAARYDPLDPAVFPLYEKAQRLGLPILSHLGTHPDPRYMLKWSMPLAIDEIAQAFPEFRFVIAHMAHPWQRDCAVVLRKHLHVYADVSGVWHRPWQSWEALMGMVEWGVTDKLLFGSDFPLWTPAEGMDKLWRLNDQLEGTKLPRIPDEVIDGIIHRNSLELLGLE